MPLGRIEAIDDVASKRDEEVLHRQVGLGGHQVVAKNIELVLCLVFSTQDTVLFGLVQRDSVGDTEGQRFVNIETDLSGVGGEVVALDDTLQILEIDVFLLHLLFERVGAEVELIDLAVEVGVGVARDVFAQGRESDDEACDDDEQQGHADDDQHQIEEVQPEVEHRPPTLVVRHEEVVLAIELLQRDIA